MRKVDELGRVVIPSSLRKKYGLLEGTEVDFLESNEGVTIKVATSICRICGSKISSDATLPLCDKCISDAANIHLAKSNSSKEDR